MMVHTTELERRMTKGATYRDCFRVLNRTEVSLCPVHLHVIVSRSCRRMLTEPY